MRKYKGFLIFPEEWLGDMMLSMCSYSAKGAWMDLMCFMHKSEKYGHLVSDGKALTKSDIASLLKFKDEKEFDSAWEELLSKGVLKKNAQDEFFSEKLLRLQQTVIAPAKNVDMDMGIQSKQILEYFDKMSSNKTPYDKNEAETIIIDQLKKGYVLNEFFDVITFKNEEWKESEKMKKYIRPATLFGQKFDSYLKQVKHKQEETPKEQKKGYKMISYDNM